MTYHSVDKNMTKIFKKTHYLGLSKTLTDIYMLDHFKGKKVTFHSGIKSSPLIVSVHLKIRLFKIVCRLFSSCILNSHLDFCHVRPEVFYYLVLRRFLPKPRVAGGNKNTMTKICVGELKVK